MSYDVLFYVIMFILCLLFIGIIVEGVQKTNESVKARREWKQRMDLQKEESCKDL